MQKNNLVFSYHNYMKIDECSEPLNIYVSGPRIVTKRKMYNYGYPGCLTFMYSAKTMGLIQIKDIKRIMTMQFFYNYVKKLIVIC